MNFDKDAAKKLDEKEASKLLLQNGLIFDFLGGILLLTGFVLLIQGKELYYFMFGGGIVLFVLGIKNLFVNKNKKERLLTSILLESAIKQEQQNGRTLSNEEISQIKFEYDPIFHDKVIKDIHTSQDNLYMNNVKTAEARVNELTNAKKREINRIRNKRWESIANGKLKFNIVEGKVEINKSTYLFSSIKSAEIVKENSTREEKIEKSSSKKHISYTGAIAGKMLLGPVGAVLGGATGRKDIDTHVVSNTIPICLHLSVTVDIDGFKNDIILISKPTDLTDSIYVEALDNAEEIVSKLLYLSKQPVPKKYLEVEEEPTVLELDKKLDIAKKELKEIKANVPTYEVPEVYIKKQK